MIVKIIIDSLEEKKKQPETVTALYQKRMEIYPVNTDEYRYLHE